MPGSGYDPDVAFRRDGIPRIPAPDRRYSHAEETRQGGTGREKRQNGAKRTSGRLASHGSCDKNKKKHDNDVKHDIALAATGASTLDTPGARLEAAILTAGWSIKQFSRVCGVDYHTLWNHVRDRFVWDADLERIYAGALGLKPGALQFGDTSKSPSHLVVTRALVVPIVGTVGGGKRGRLSTEAPIGTVYVDLSALAYAFLVSGNEYEPKYSNGDRVLCRSLSPETFNGDCIAGRDAIVMLANGSVLLRHVERADAGAWELSTWQSGRAAMLTHSIIAGARVELIVPA